MSDMIKEVVELSNGLKVELFREPGCEADFPWGERGELIQDMSKILVTNTSRKLYSSARVVTPEGVEIPLFPTKRDYETEREMSLEVSGYMVGIDKEKAQIQKKTVYYDYGYEVSARTMLQLNKKGKDVEVREMEMNSVYRHPRFFENTYVNGQRHGKETEYRLGADSEKIKVRDAEWKNDKRDGEVEVPSPLEYGWGEFATPEDGERKYRTTESEFVLSHVAQPSLRSFAVTAWTDNANLHIEAPCEWMELVRTAVSDSTGYPRKNILVHPAKYTSKHDEYFISPAVLAVLAASAAIKTGLPSEIKDRAIYSRPEITVKRSTLTDEEGKPLSETVAMTVDMGAYPVMPDEYQRQAMAGLIPPYPLKQFNATVSIKNKAIITIR